MEDVQGQWEVPPLSAELDEHRAADRAHINTLAVQILKVLDRHVKPPGLVKRTDGGTVGVLVGQGAALHEVDQRSDLPMPPAAAQSKKRVVAGHGGRLFEFHVEVNIREWTSSPI